MRNRYLVLGLSAFLALALAVPALGGPSNPIADVSATAKKTAKKALKKSKKAQQSADAAQQSANQAQSSADNAQTTAGGAQTAAEGAQTAAEAAQATADSKLGTTSDVSGTRNPAAGTNTTSPKISTAVCPSGQQATGGGYSAISADDTLVTDINEPYGNGWFVQQDDTAGDAWAVQASVFCASP